MNRIKRYQGMVTMLMGLAMVWGCGGNGEPGTGDGGIRFAVSTTEADTHIAENRHRPAGRTVAVRIAGAVFSVDEALAAGFLESCNGDLFTIEARVYNTAGATIASAGPWPCSRHSGAVMNVSPGPDRRIAVHARGPDGELTYHGEKDGLAVLPGEVTDAGVIRLLPHELTGHIPMSDGAMIYYDMAGEGPPLILIHGGEQDSSSWDYQIAALSEWYTVIRYDIRDFGRSYYEYDNPWSGTPPGGIPDPISNWSWDDGENRLTTDLVEIMEYMNLDRAHICGLSIGSSIAAQLSVFHPDKVDLLIHTSPWYGENFPTDDAQLDAVRALTDQTLVILGADDFWGSPEYMETMKTEENYHPTTVVIDDAGHNCNVDQPEIYTQHVLAWLRREIVSFPDPNLEAAIRRELDKPEGAILSSELRAIRVLELPLADIQSIEGLQYCANLTDLDLRSNLVSDISPLAGLPNLQRLDLNGNPVSDISALAGLTTLTELSISWTDVTDLSPIAGLENLDTLYLWGLGIQDISAVAMLEKLTVIILGDNAIQDISPLTNLVNLDLVLLDNNEISDISPLVDNPGIGSGDEVLVNYNPLSEVSCAVHIPALESRGVFVEHFCGFL